MAYADKEKEKENAKRQYLKHKQQLLEKNKEAFLKECCERAVKFLNKYKIPVTDARLLQLQN